MAMATCEICGLEGPESSMRIGWAVACKDNPECRPPMTRPQRREVATLTTELLDRLEWHADHGETCCTDAEVVPAVLRALIDAARQSRPSAFDLVERELRGAGVETIDLCRKSDFGDQCVILCDSGGASLAMQPSLVEAVDASRR